MEVHCKKLLCPFFSLCAVKGMNESTARSAYLQDSGYRSKIVHDLLLQEIVISIFILS